MTKIAELKEKERYTINLLIKSCVKGVTQKGAPYLNMVLQDSTGTIDGKFWDAKPEDMTAVIPGHVEEITFEVLEYNHNLQLRVNRVRDVDQNSINMSEYIMSSGISINELKSKLDGYMDSIVNPVYKALVKGMYKKAGQRIYEYPAASRIHHNYMGGLSEHILGMADLADQISGAYPVLNRDLLIAGVLVHDLGKTVELGGLISSEYTTEGKLTGHISIGHGWLLEVADQLGFGDKEEALLLRHMILSHHGKYEFGSPILPEIPEAEALYLIDNIDARMNTLYQQMKQIKPGQWTPRLFSLENRQFYKPKEG